MLKKSRFYKLKLKNVVVICVFLNNNNNNYIITIMQSLETVETLLWFNRYGGEVKGGGRFSIFFSELKK